MRTIGTTHELTITVEEVLIIFEKDTYVDVELIKDIIKGNVKISEYVFIGGYHVEVVFEENMFRYNPFLDSFDNFHGDPLIEGFIDVKPGENLFLRLRKLIRKIQELGFTYKRCYNRGHTRRYHDGTFLLDRKKRLTPHPNNKENNP